MSIEHTITVVRLSYLLDTTIFFINLKGRDPTDFERGKALIIFILHIIPRLLKRSDAILPR
jgi:hypothetical protein